MSAEQELANANVQIATLINEVTRLRDSVMGLNNIYATVTEGRQSVPDGRFFAVAGSGAYMRLYQRNGASATLIAEYPSAEAMAQAVSDAESAAGTATAAATAVADNVGNASALVDAAIEAAEDAVGAASAANDSKLAAAESADNLQTAVQAAEDAALSAGEFATTADQKREAAEVAALTALDAAADALSSAQIALQVHVDEDDPHPKYATKVALNSVLELLQSDDTTLDELQEIVEYIKLNRADLDALNIDAIAGLQDALDGKAALMHTHDDRYYTQAQIDSQPKGDPWTRPAESIVFNHATDGTITGIEEVVDGDLRVTSYTYGGGVISQSETHYQGLTRTESYTYSNGTLSGSSAAITESV
jgi:hypothetical protein